MATVGFFGKLPSNGDFIERRVDDTFRDVWDGWLQRSMAQSQRALGGDWLDCYLTSPFWRFVLCDGVAGGTSFAGVLVPSVDRVGRYFPLTVVVALPTDIAPLAFAREAGPWFVAVERLCADALASHDLKLADFDESLQASAGLLANTDVNSAAEPLSGSAAQWRWGIHPGRDLEATFGTALMRTAQGVLRPMSMWWTEGSERVEPSAVLVRGLPKPESFGAFLAGTWDDGQWQGELHAMPPVPVLQPERSFRTESAGATDVGPVRAQNEDSFILNDNLRLWAVADGMGGHRDGGVASRMVVDALNSLEPTASLSAVLEAVRAALAHVNADLRRAALSVDGPEGICGSTVAALAIRGGQFAACWAGDSRVYLYRDSVLAQVTQDHVVLPVINGEKGSLLASFHVSGEVSRAVGGTDVLELDDIIQDLAPEDRFLICSDGLYGALDEASMAECLRLESCREAAQELIKRAVAAGARDNVTAVIVHATADT